MIEVSADRSTPRCIISRWAGPTFTATEMDALGEAIDAAVMEAHAAGTDASAVFIFDSMPMVADWEAFKSDLGFVRHHYSELARVAYVGDVAWIDFKVNAFGWMTKPKDRTFPASALEEAVAWAGGTEVVE